MPHRGEEGRQQNNPTRLPCTAPGCRRWFKNASGRTQHYRSHHQARAESAEIQRSPTSSRNAAPTHHAASVVDNPTDEGPLILESPPPTPPYSPGQRGMLRFSLVLPPVFHS